MSSFRLTLGKPWQELLVLVRLCLLIIFSAVAGVVLWFYAMLVIPHHDVSEHFLYGAACIGLGLFIAAMFLAVARDQTRWLFGKESNRLYRWIFVSLVSLIVLFYSIEKWRGKRLWAGVERELAARGEKPTPWGPPPLPVEKDMAQTPIFAPLSNFSIEHRPEWTIVWHDKPGYDRLAAIQLPHLTPKNLGGLFAIHLSPWLEQKTFDLDEAADKIRPESKLHLPEGSPQALLAYIDKFTNDLEQVREASRREGASFKPCVQRNEILVQLATVFAWRAVAELQIGQSDEAVEDIRCGMRLARTSSQQYAWSATDTGTLMVGLALQPLWEGLSKHQWSDSHLSIIQSDLGAYNYLSLQSTHQRETIWGHMDAINQVIPITPPMPDPIADVVQSSPLLPWVRLVYPKGWSYQDQAAMYWFGRQLSTSVDAAKQRVFPKVLDQEPPIWPEDPFFATLGTNSLKTGFRIFGYSSSLAQTCVNLANTACALERHHLAEGRYPEKLDALAPKFMPAVPGDLFTGQPLRYQPTSNGQFVLSSLSWEQAQDLTTAGTTHGEWRWSYSRPSPER